MSDELLCPICLNKSKKKNFQFRCSCGEKFNINELSFWEKLMGRKEKTIQVCPKCNNSSQVIVCPNEECKSALPSSLLLCEPIFFSVIGLRSSGKSHFIAQIIETLSCLSEFYNWELMSADSQTHNIYLNKYKNPLYNDLKPLDATKESRGFSVRPLFYSLQLKKPHSKKRIMLLFYDAAGEDLLRASISQLEITHKYLSSSSGILLLIDPLSMPIVQEDDCMVSYFNKFKKNSDNSKCSNMLAKISDILGHLRYEIPLAVSFSKIDAVRDLFGDDCSIFTSKEKKSYLDLKEIDVISEEMNSWLNHYQGSDDILKEVNSFTFSKFFGISSIGNVMDLVKGEPILLDIPSPIRIEDPFLWLMYKNNLIKGK